MTIGPPAPVDAELFAEIGRLLARPGGRSVFERLTRIAADLVPGAEQAGVTLQRRGVCTTEGATSPDVLAVDQVQYDLNTGPCVDARGDETVLRSDDLGVDPRWPDFGVQAAALTPLRSVLSFGLFLGEGADIVATLNLYATATGAFDDESARLGLILATHGGLAIAGALARERTANLERALENSREIGIAMGIVMALHKVPRDEAFDLLRNASQATHRKLAELVRDVVDTGVVPAVAPSSKPRG